MIQSIGNKCVGCAACVDICPLSAIHMSFDKDGFWQPVVDLELCNKCGICLNLCPVSECYSIPDICSQTSLFYAAFSKNNQTQKESSSGGVFTELATSVLKKGGVVVGAEIKGVDVSHVFVESIDDLHRLRGSKYTQSKTTGIYKAVAEKLQSGTLVLFVGTPCQIAALNSYLAQKQTNKNKLITCDFICHGIGSYNIFLDYVNEKAAGRKIASIFFREKKYGWLRFRMVINFDDGTHYSATFYRDHFMCGFHKNYHIRRSCYDCSFVGLARQSDITFADFWNVPKEMYEHNGVSMVIVNTPKGRSLFDETSFSLNVKETTQKCATSCNKGLINGKLSNIELRDQFFVEYHLHGYSYVCKKYLTPSWFKILLTALKYIKDDIL